MPEVEEHRIYEELLKLKGKAKAIMKDGREVTVSIDPIDNHFSDSPDFIIWIEVSFKVFGEDLTVRIPLPVEAEKGGIYGGALEDLGKFVQRKKHTIELPMLVIAESGFDDRQETSSLPVKFSLRQIPVRQTTP